MTVASRGKLAIILTAFLDFTGFAVIAPVLPNFSEKYGASLFAVSLLGSAYALIGLFASPIAGALSDRLGRKKVLFASVFLAAIGWAVMALAPNFAILMVGRMIGGLAFGNIAIVQAMLGDIGKDAKERTMNLALFGVAVGVSFVVGPLVGGWLGGYSVAAVLWFAMGLSLTNALAIWLFVPETGTDLNHERPVGILRSIADTVTDPRLAPGLAMWLLMMMGLACYQATLPLILDLDFHLGSTAVGNVLGLMGVAILINQGFFMRKFWLKRSQGANVWTATVGAIVAAVAIPLTGTLWGMLAALVALSVFQGVFRPVANNLLMEAAPGAKRGEVNGVASSAMTLSMIVCPALGGWMLESGVSPFWATAFFFLLTALFLPAALRAAAAGNPDRRGDVPPAGILE